MISQVLVAVLLLTFSVSIKLTFGQEEGSLGFLGFDASPPAKVFCPDIRAVSNFKLDQYMGRWYELERFDSPFQSGDCGTVDYTLGPNGTFTLVKTEVSEGKKIMTEGTAVPVVGPNSSRFYITLPDIPEGDGSPNYNVVVTDYKNYAVIYTCVTFGFSEKLEFAWIMGRREKLPERMLIVVKKWLQAMGIDVSSFVKINQANCNRNPEIKQSYGLP